MKKCKSVLCLLLSLILIFGCLPAAARAAEDPNAVFTPDSKAPEILDVTFSAASVNSGDKIEVIVKAKDDLSGIQYASLYFTCEETGKGLDVYAENYYWNQETGEGFEYPQGELHGWIEINPYMQSGTFVLTDITVQDNAQNYMNYSKYYDPEYYGNHGAKLPASLAEKQFKVVNSGKLDTTYPVLNGLELSATNVEAPGTIELTLSATDDLSGISEANVSFYSAELKRNRNCWLESGYWDYNTGKYVTYTDGKLHGTMQFTAYDASTTYELQGISFGDNAQNHVYFAADANPEYAGPDYGPIPDCVKQRSFKVTNSGKLDISAPELQSVALELTTMKRPGTIEFVAQTSKTGTQAVSIDIMYRCKETDKYVYCYLESYHWDANQQEYVENEAGKLQGTMQISKYLEAGVYELEQVNIYDRNGNRTEYYAGVGQQLDPAIAAVIPQNKIYIGDVDAPAEEPKPTEPKPTEPAPTEPAPTEPAPTEPAMPENVFRVAGENRYATALDVADALKETLGVSKFDAIVVASGREFPDALAGSYLANQKKAPILLVNSKNPKTYQSVKEYIAANLASNGKVYILGGEAAVPAEMEAVLTGFDVKRLAGSGRYATNLEILKEAGVGNEEILICTGKDFADSLSASAVNKPILLLNNKTINAEQRAFLESSSKKFVIIGGPSAISEEMKAELEKIGSVERIAGNNRFETSVAVAERFFDSPKTAVVAYARNFPDGLCGGPLACALKAPMILTSAKKEDVANGYIKGNGIQSGLVMGGDNALSKDTVNKVFG